MSQITTTVQSFTQSQTSWSVKSSGSQNCYYKQSQWRLMKFQLSYFKSQNMILLKWYTQYASKFGKLSSGHRRRKSVSIPVPKKGNAKQYTNYHTFAIISHASKVMLKILEARLQQVCKLRNSRYTILDLESTEIPEIKLSKYIG